MRIKHNRIIVAVAWLILLGIGAGLILTQDLNIRQFVGDIQKYTVSHPIAPILFVLFYGLIRPVLFIPVMWLTVAAGSVFGFWSGLVFSLIGLNLSATTAYFIARFLRGTSTGDEAMAGISRLRRMLHNQTFSTVLALRAAYMPFDPINYGCGLLRVPWRSFFLGTLIGTLPPMITFVSFGTSLKLAKLVTHLDELSPVRLLDGTQLVTSLLLLTASAIIAWFAYQHPHANQD